MTYSVDLRSIQSPLKDRYRADAATALVTTRADSSPTDLHDPRHTAATPHGFPDVVIRGGLHPAAGGAGDTPCSGDVLAAALVICEESTIRSVAANLGIELEAIDVSVEIDWDFRGTMGVSRDVPVGATGARLRTKVRLKDDVEPTIAQRMLTSAERYCATLQTLRNGVDTRTEFIVDR